VKLGSDKGSTRKLGAGGVSTDSNSSEECTYEVDEELGYGDQYKYNPNYKEGRVVQEYLPEFLEERDLSEMNRTVRVRVGG
jgi:hypothetical protein